MQAGHEETEWNDRDLERFQAIVDYNTPDLLDLIRLALASTGLEVEDLGNSASEEDVVTSFNAFLKSQYA
jgi:hypothetical protein